MNASIPGGWRLSRTARPTRRPPRGPPGPQRWLATASIVAPVVFAPLPAAPASVEATDACYVSATPAGGRTPASAARTPHCTVEELMRTALLFVIVVAIVATGLWRFVPGCFSRARPTSGTLSWRLADRLVPWRELVGIEGGV